MKANNGLDDTNDFTEAFMADDIPETEPVAPEEMVATRPAKNPKKGTNLVRYLIYGFGGLVLLFVILFIWAAVTADSSETARQQQTQQASHETNLEATGTGTVPAASVTAKPIEHEPQEEDFEDVAQLKAQLNAAQQNTAIRDEKYKALARAYIQLQADYKLLQDNQNKYNGRNTTNKPEYAVLPVLKGVSLVSVYDGYAFVKKGNTVYSVKKGDKVNNAIVIEIDPVLRKVITAKGVIE
ncbi:MULTISPECIES: hypothetical protein [Enterobacteriaceae]|uniref:hypothetical protein n=1 Tax=Enterobacteriaceae TaxID=543 RepID=UPI002B2E2962|nr:hypothetical protein R0Q77_27795 [Citrobacter braakii]